LHGRDTWLDIDALAVDMFAIFSLRRPNVLPVGELSGLSLLRL
jgi:hypothetical protein